MYTCTLKNAPTITGVIAYGAHVQALRKAGYKWEDISEDNSVLVMLRQRDDGNYRIHEVQTIDGDWIVVDDTKGKAA